MKDFEKLITHLHSNNVDTHTLSIFIYMGYSRSNMQNLNDVSNQKTLRNSLLSALLEFPFNLGITPNWGLHVAKQSSSSFHNEDLFLGG